MEFSIWTDNNWSAVLLSHVLRIKKAMRVCTEFAVLHRYKLLCIAYKIETKLNIFGVLFVFFCQLCRLKQDVP